MWGHRADEVRRPADDGSILVEESEAFLGGRLVEYLDGRLRPVPGWVVLNTVAHGTRREIVALADGADTIAERFLAEEILAAAPNDVMLRALQRSAMIPLELALLDTAGGSFPRTMELVRPVIEIVRAFRDNTRL